MTKIICISDTHNMHRRMEVPFGDILVHCGDFSKIGTLEETGEFLHWMDEQPHQYKIFISGNHDFYCQDYTEELRKQLNGIIYLQDEEVTINGLRIYGSPWQPKVTNTWAFNYRRGSSNGVWDKIPEGLDILITHGPPNGILDFVERHRGMDVFSNVGCEELWTKVISMSERPKVHMFGHIHEGYGIQESYGVKFINAASCTRLYQPTNPPIVIEL